MAVVHNDMHRYEQFLQLIVTLVLHIADDDGYEEIATIC